MFDEDGDVRHVTSSRTRTSKEEGKRWCIGNLFVIFPLMKENCNRGKREREREKSGIVSECCGVELTIGRFALESIRSDRCDRVRIEIDLFVELRRFSRPKTIETVILNVIAKVLS